MKPFSPRGQKRLKILHITFAGTWLSSAVTLALVSWLLSASDDIEMLGVHRTTKFIDDFILIPAANGTWITGLLYSLKTRWGWFRYRWVVVKWAVALSGILVGTFVLGPSLNSLPVLVRQLGPAAFADPAYVFGKTVLLCVAPFQVATLLLACCLSVLKPWDRAPARPSGSSAGSGTAR